jgi:uncharacterized Fe-S cluster-containing radical SAM superfamily enzyme
MGKIARAHPLEIKNYYSWLDKMEKEAEEKLNGLITQKNSL